MYVPGEDGASSLKDCYLELDVNVTQRAGGHARYADGDHKKLLNLGSFASFKNTD